MEELIARKYEDILNKRRALYIEILTSEKDLEDMLKETISMRRKLERITLLKKKKNSYFYESIYPETNV